MTDSSTISPPPHPTSPQGSGVRRHHTISSSSRAARNAARIPISEEGQGQTWDDDEIVGEEWVGGVGAVGEKSGLHRQSSLPSKYGRPFRSRQSGTASGTMTPSRTVNSLSAITAEHGVEGDAEEEEWEREMRGWTGAEETSTSPPVPVVSSSIQQPLQPAPQSPLSPGVYSPPHMPSPPPAATGVRRHQSLTYGSSGAVRRGVLKRSGTQTNRSRNNQNQSPSPPSAEEEFAEEEATEYVSQQPAPPQQPQQQQQTQQAQQPTSPLGRSPWGTPGNEWRSPNTNPHLGNGNVDDIQRALSTLELASQSQQLGGQSAHPPRFNPSHPPAQQAPGMRGGQPNPGRKLQLITDLNGPAPQGPVSASAYVPPIGHGLPQIQTRGVANAQAPAGRSDDRAFTASGVVWDQKERILGSRASNPNLAQQFYNGGFNANNLPPPPPIPQQYLQQPQHSGRLGINTAVSAVPSPASAGTGQQNLQPQSGPGQGGYLSSPIDVPSLIATKGYNPATFDVRPNFARYFVIKSYTEDDVHKSLKYEIWSSTDPGNKRLDKAFKECAGRGPIYLFFSVNASGHFCGMAEMLTPVDYTRSSTVWASDKWKGVFKVRWIFVRDVPNATLRHIRLNNTQERKPVTNSRDTQELLPDAGQEMLRIFFTHPARTSLLQDFAFYELQSLQKMAPQAPPSPAPQPYSPQQTSPIQQHPFAMPNPATMPGYTNTQHLQMPQMLPMQLSPPGQYAHPQTIQSVLRNPSPGPGQGYMQMGMGNF